MSLLSSFWEGFLESFSVDPNKSPFLFSVLNQTKPLEITEDKIVLGYDNQGVRIYLEKRTQEIELELKNYAKKRVKVEFSLIEKKKKQDSPLLSFRPSIEDVFVKSGLHNKYNFDNFAVSSTNQVAYAAAQAISNNPGTAYNPLFLYGGVGVGKTHLAQAVARKILEQDSGKKVYFCPGEHFTNEVIESIRENTTSRFRRKYRYLNLLILDDVQFIAGKTHIQEEFFHTFNSIVSAGGQIILNSDKPPSEIKNLEDRLRSRFSGGLIVDIQPPDFELRTAIILIKAKEKNIEINIEAAKIIAERVADSRALEGTLLSIYAKILGTKEKIDLDVVDAFFSEKMSTQVKKIQPSDVIKAVCLYYDVKQSKIKDSIRTDAIALPRQIIMYILREKLDLKQDEIAYILRRKDHTTVIHGVDKINGLIMRDPAFKQGIDKILQSLSLST